MGQHDKTQIENLILKINDISQG